MSTSFGRLVWTGNVKVNEVRRCHTGRSEHESGRDSGKILWLDPDVKFKQEILLWLTGAEGGMSGVWTKDETLAVLSGKTPFDWKTRSMSLK
jgi:hypothetical protein